MSLVQLADRAADLPGAAGWAFTLRMSFDVTRGGVFGKAPEADIRAAMGRALVERICPYSAANILPCGQCLMRAECAYPRAFKPVVADGDPSFPAPYVLSYFGPERLWSGAPFCIDLTMVGGRRADVIHLERAALDAFERGVGRAGERIAARLIAACPLGSLALPDSTRVRVICRTPIAIKGRAERAGWLPETFEKLVVDRMRALTGAYGREACPPPPRSDLVTANAKLDVVTRHGFSTAQQRGIEARGWLGSFELAPGWQAWRDVLAAIGRLGVGRHTAWGNGQLQFEGIEPRRRKGRS